MSPALSGGFFTTEPLAAAAAAKPLQLCSTLCDPIDGSPPGSSVHGTFQARVLEWGAIAFSTQVPSGMEKYSEVLVKLTTAKGKTE